MDKIRGVFHNGMFNKIDDSTIYTQNQNIFRLGLITFVNITYVYTLSTIFYGKTNNSLFGIDCFKYYKFILCL